MKDMIRKFFAAVLVLGMVCACLPVIAFAEDGYSAMLCENLYQVVPGARYLIIADGTDLGLADFNEAETALELKTFTEGEEPGYIDGLTDDDFFVLDCIDEEYWTITTPGGKGVAARPLDEEGHIYDGLTPMDGFPWELIVSGEDELLFRFEPYDDEISVTLAVDTEENRAYAVGYTENKVTDFKLYICVEDSDVEPMPEVEAVEIEEAQAIIPDIFCGDHIEIPVLDPDEEIPDPDVNYDNVPGVTVPDGVPYIMSAAYWLTPSDDPEAALGFTSLEEDFDVKGGEKYYVGVLFMSNLFDLFDDEDPVVRGGELMKKVLKGEPADLGARRIGTREEGDVMQIGFFTENTKYVASNAKLVASAVDVPISEDETQFLLGIAVFELEAEHVPGESKEENRVEPTCLDEGSYDDNTYCDECGELLETHHEMLEPLGHDWGDWVVTKEPTATEYGEETRVCKRDPSHVETRPIDPTGVPDTGDDTSVARWMVMTVLPMAALLFLRKRENA